MKWSELTYDDYYVPYDDNQKVIRGFFLATLGVDLRELPEWIFEPFHYFESRNNRDRSQCVSRKVYLSDINGTSFSAYGGKDIITAFMKIKRACPYILAGEATRKKYFHMLKKPVCEQELPIILSKNDDGYYVDGNGNHRIVLYKIMMLAEIADAHKGRFLGDAADEVRAIRKKYWLNAKINP